MRAWRPAGGQRGGDPEPRGPGGTATPRGTASGSCPWGSGRVRGAGGDGGEGGDGGGCHPGPWREGSCH